MFYGASVPPDLHSHGEPCTPGSGSDSEALFHLSILTIKSPALGVGIRGCVYVYEMGWGDGLVRRNYVPHR